MQSVMPFLRFLLYSVLLTRIKSYAFGVVISPIIIFFFCDFSVLKFFGLFLPSGKHIKHFKIVCSHTLIKAYAKFVIKFINTETV